MRPQRVSFAFQHAKSTVVSIVRQAKAYSSETQHERFFFFCFGNDKHSDVVIMFFSPGCRLASLHSIEKADGILYVPHRRTLGAKWELRPRGSGGPSHKACKQDERRKTRAR